MSWNDVLGHDNVIERFRTSIRLERMASTFLFVGPGGIGKKTFALKLAQALLCETNPESMLEPCETCPACQQVAALTHPDLEVVSRPKGKNFIPIEMFIGDREHRMQEGLCHNISLKPFRGGRKIAIIDDADFLNQEGANCLLKTLEEPPPKSVLILISESEHRQLSTIRSRSQIVRFNPLTDEHVAHLLESKGLVDEGIDPRQVAQFAKGSLTYAVLLQDPDLRSFRETLFENLARIDWEPVGFPKLITSFVEEAGKEAPKRRERLRIVIDMVMSFYQQLMLTLAGNPPAADEVLAKYVNAAARNWRGDDESVAASIDRCLDAHSQLAANANISTLIEAWLDDLAGIGVSGSA